MPDYRHSTPGHWADASSLWPFLGPPLRPHPDDIVIVEGLIGEWAARQDRAPRALILGVTPELQRLAWPSGSVVHALDRSEPMIRNVWPGPTGSAQLGDWLDLGTEAEARDIVLCDGGLHLLAYPADQSLLATALARLIRPGGILVLRLFSGMLGVESPEAVLASVHAGQLSSMDELKLRLLVALQDSPERGVRLDDAWSSLHKAFGDWETLSHITRWPFERISVVDTYRGNQATYHFAGRDWVEQAFVQGTAGAFRLAHAATGSYSGASACPTLAFERIGAAA
jgi:hypothetical protein